MNRSANVRSLQAIRDGPRGQREQQHGHEFRQTDQTKV